MITVAWIFAIWIAGFLGGYALRSYVSVRRRRRARRARYEFSSTRRTLSPAEDEETIELATAPNLAPEGSPPRENIARADRR
jgi:hypothetical protein